MFHVCLPVAKKHTLTTPQENLFLETLAWFHRVDCTEIILCLPCGLVSCIGLLAVLAKQVTTTTDVVVTAVPEQGETCNIGDGIDLQ